MSSEFSFCDLEIAFLLVQILYYYNNMTNQKYHTSEGAKMKPLIHKHMAWYRHFNKTLRGLTRFFWDLNLLS